MKKKTNPFICNGKATKYFIEHFYQQFFTLYIWFQQIKSRETARTKNSPKNKYE